MSWQRVVGVVAAVVVAMAAATACGGSTVIGVTMSGAMADAGSEPDPDAVAESGSDAVVDSSDDIDAGAPHSCMGLTPADAGDGVACNVNGPSEVSCLGERRFRYFCGSTTAPPTAPSIDGCVFSTWAFGMFDCPAAMVRNETNDATCSGQRAFEVPSVDGVSSAVPLPSACGSLRHVPGTTPSELLTCCP